MEKIIKIRVKNLDAFRQWQALGAAINADKKKLEALHTEAGLPKSKQFKKKCGGYLVDGNNNAVAKFVVFRQPEKQMSAFWACRIS